MKLDFAEFRCSIARTLDHFEPMWTPLILRDVFFGLRRFDQICVDLGIASNVLTTRLEALVDKGILERVPYQERPPRYEYRPTRKGKDLFPILLGMMHWGDTWLSERAGPPVRIRHEPCGHFTGPRVVCNACGEPITLDNVTVHAGPSALATRGTALLATELPPEEGPKTSRKRLRERLGQAIVATLEVLHSAGTRYQQGRLGRAEHDEAKAFHLVCSNEAHRETGVADLEPP
ncbi:helix-turn-helix transcriptional regulator [Pendulispora brunnea]|uniref:Helix-turn-helix transcriptional regulator n=1 Tax=Pendulispora brunnea TaxID=2905690 RepID=A0ABZ2K6Y5_9BACT